MAHTSYISHLRAVDLRHALGHDLVSRAGYGKTMRYAQAVPRLRATTAAGGGV